MTNSTLTLNDTKVLDIVPETKGPESLNSGPAPQYEKKAEVLFIVSEPEIFYKPETTMTQRFIKFIPSEEADFLQENYPNAFLLLCQIAKRARRISGKPDGLQIGEAQIGDYKKSGIESRKKYRTALSILQDRGHVKIIETCRTRNLKGQKSATEGATGKTTIGTKVSILRSDIWDINPEECNEQFGHDKGHRRATEGPRTRKNKKEKEDIEDSLHSSSFPNAAQSPCSKKNSDELLFSFENKKFENISDQDLFAWSSAYPGVDFHRELAKASEWLLSNPAKARKKTQWRRFLTSWFSKASDFALCKAASFSQKQDLDKEKNWSTENRQAFFRWKSESKDVLKHMEYKDEFVINRKNGKEISTKMAPAAFLENFTHVAGVRSNG